MTKDQIYEQLNDIFHDTFDDDSIRVTPETTAADVPDWDSVNHINLMVAVEARFKIKFKTAELESLHNVGHLVDLIQSKLESR